MPGSQRILLALIAFTCLNQVSSVRFYRLPPTFKLTSKEVDHLTTDSIWTCFANAEAYDPEWTHFCFDAFSSRCSLRGGLVSFDFMDLRPMGTVEAPLPGNFYVKDVAGRLATVDGCPAETVLRELVCALPQPLPPGPADCNALESLVSITSANETALTNALFRGKCSEYGRNFYGSTVVYRKRIVEVLWNGTLTIADRIEQASGVLDSYGSDDQTFKKYLLASPVGGWGTICDFLACAKLRFPSVAIKPKTCASSSTTGAGTTTTAASTSLALTWTAVTSIAALPAASTIPATTSKSSDANRFPTTTASSDTTTSSRQMAPTATTTTAKATIATNSTSTSTSTTVSPSITTSPSTTTAPTCQQLTSTVPFYRAYRADINDYLYTTSSSEAKQTGGYEADGIAGRILPTRAPNSVALYRLFHTGNQSHFYTTSQPERMNVIQQHGYTDKGVVGYVYGASVSNPSCPCPEVLPLYRMSKHAPHFVYFYTMDDAERDQAIRKHGYVFDGIAACIYPK